MRLPLGVALILALVLLACVDGPTSPSISSEKELWATAEVERLAAKLHKKIGAEFTAQERRISAGVGGCPKDAEQGYCNAAAWYLPPVVFWKGWLDRETTTLRDITNVAGHEVCHSVSLGHDQLHYNCMLAVGTEPTYTVSGVWNVYF